MSRSMFSAYAAGPTVLALVMMVASVMLANANDPRKDESLVEAKNAAERLGTIKTATKAESFRPWQPHVKATESGRSRSQWFGSDLGDLGAPKNGLVKRTTRAKQHQVDGFVLDEIRVRHQQNKHNIRFVANAGIPILQASKMKPTVRDILTRDRFKDSLSDDYEPGDGFAAPRDVENSPGDAGDAGDALLQMSEEKPSGIMRRELLPARSSLGQINSKPRRDGSDCEKCMDCHGAAPNALEHEHAGETEHSGDSGGVFCMCFKGDEWATKTHAKDKDGGEMVYPGVSDTCTSGCVAETDAAANAGFDLSTCASMNCSCDLNVYWAK